MLDELRTLLEFKPSTDNHTATKSLLDYIEGVVRLKGMHVKRYMHNGIPSLYASTHGQMHAKVMLQGHVDVVSGGQPFSRDDDTIYGRGCYDMLFAIASYVTLIKSLDDVRDYDMSLFLTADEEIGGLNGTKAVLDTTKISCGVCILPDAGDSLGSLSIAAKGIYQLVVQVNGRSHHASRPWEGDGAANKLIAFLAAANKLFDTSDQANSTFAITQLSVDNTSLNLAPDTATAGIDIRYKDADDFARIRTELVRLQQTYNISIVFEEIGRNFALNTATPLVEQFLGVYKSHVGKPIVFEKSPGSSDARYFDDIGVPVIMLRPDGGNAHGDGEWLSYSSWQKFHTILEHYVEQTAKTT